jgi:hypothetical protein
MGSLMIMGAIIFADSFGVPACFGVSVGFCFSTGFSIAGCCSLQAIIVSKMMAVTLNNTAVRYNVSDLFIALTLLLLYCDIIAVKNKGVDARD